MRCIDSLQKGKVLAEKDYESHDSEVTPSSNEGYSFAQDNKITIFLLIFLISLIILLILKDERITSMVRRSSSKAGKSSPNVDNKSNSDQVIQSTLASD